MFLTFLLYSSIFFQVIGSGRDIHYKSFALIEGIQ